MAAVQQCQCATEGKMMGEHETHLRVTAFEQCAKQAGKQLGLLASGSSTVCSGVNRQQATKPSSVVVQDVADVL